MEEPLRVGSAGCAEGPVPSQVLVDKCDLGAVCVKVHDCLAASADGLRGLGRGWVAVLPYLRDQGA